MKHRLLAVDLDGTLVRRDGTIDERDRRAIEAVQQLGVVVTVVTGRLYSGSRDVARAVRMMGPIACVDGSHIVHLDGDRDALHSAICGEHATKLRHIVERHHAASFLFAHDTIVHDPRGDPYAAYVRGWSPNISQVERVTAHPYWEDERGILALVAVGADDEIAEAAQQIRSELGGAACVASFSVSRSATGLSALVVRAAGSTKGTAIEWLAAYYGHSAAEVVAVGDWLNDVPMFEVAGRSFVMAQAPESVKAFATDRLMSDHNGGGIAEAIAAVWGLSV